MPVWWRYDDLVDAVGEARAVTLARELLRGLVTGTITATADSIFYSSSTELVRQDFVIVPPAVFRETRTIFSGGKRISFRPEIGKFFNPSGFAPEGFEVEETDRWSIDCFGLAYRGEELIKELGLPAHEALQPGVDQGYTKRGGGRRPSVEGWSRFAAALAVWVHKRDDEATGIASVGPDELLAELDLIAMNELPKSLAGDLPRGTYQNGASAVLEAFSHIARK